MADHFNETNYPSHTGNELELMLGGRKPMAVFYRAVEEDIDETNGQPFHRYVKSGDLIRTIFYISNPHQRFKMVYYVYTVKGEEWRAKIYKKIKKIGQEKWCRDLEIIEGTLLGYSLNENMVHIRSMYGANAN